VSGAGPSARYDGTVERRDAVDTVRWLLALLD